MSCSGTRAGSSLLARILPQAASRRAAGRLERAPYHLETSLPGVFAAGDVRFQSAKRVASAVGEGAMAVMLVHRYLDRSD